MNQGKYIFAQLTDFLPRRVFDRIVDKFEGNKRVRSFTCYGGIMSNKKTNKASMIVTSELTVNYWIK